LKRLKVLLCFDYQNNITNKEKDLMFISEPKLFSIVIISIPLETLETIIINIVEFEKTTKTTNSKTKPSHNLSSIETPNTFDKKPKVSLEGKVYLETYYHHMPSQVQINKTPTKVQV
jgi:hypothetical protein